ncbi:MAG: hypothetical protein Q7J47_16060 [Azoarcus sp.]|nr:hypothetical protein [Azoarcus sp.]
MNSVQVLERPEFAAASRSGWLRVLLPLLILNTLLTFGNDWPGLGVRFDLLLSVELCLGASVLLLWVGRRGQPSAQVLSALSVVFVMLVIARYVEVTVPAVFGRPVNLYWDGRHAWQVLRMAAGELAPWRLAGGGLLLAGAAVLLFLLVRRMFGMLARGFGTCAGHRWMLATGFGAVLLHMAQPWLAKDVRAAFSTPVSAGIVSSGGQLRTALSPRSAERLGESPVFSGGVEALRGSDVLLIFAEAYGAVTFDDPEIVAALADSRAALAHAAQESERGVVSARVRSPTFGGGSWLAHAALLSGVDTRDPGDYELLLTTDRPTLVSHFARNGYRTVAWMPGLQRPWPEGSFYGFDRYGDADGIGYAGPAFGYWRIPDQASLALLQAQELGVALAASGPERGMPDSRVPRFVVFPTVSSHAPFRPVAPYVSDWSRLLRDDAYTPAQLDEALNEPVSWAEPLPGYLQSMRYTFEWLSGYLRAQAPPDLLTIVIGDHQPVAGVSGRDASWEVPVHVFSADPALLARFEAAGFSAGLRGDVPLLGDMHELTGVLVDVFAVRNQAR